MTVLVVADVERWFHHEITGDPIRVFIPAGTELPVWCCVDAPAVGHCVQILWQDEAINLPLSDVPTLWRLVR